MSLENKIIDYNIHKEDILHWVNLKGEYRYDAIIDFMKQLNIECTWQNVTAYIKYDKRLLINLFKYLVFFEEFMKAYLMNFRQEKPTKIISYSFSKTLDKFLENSKNVEYDDININLIHDYKKSINSLRNSVVHNRILLTHKYEGQSLEEILNIVNLILPKSYRNGFLANINECTKNLIYNTWAIKIEDR